MNLANSIEKELGVLKCTQKIHRLDRINSGCCVYHVLTGIGGAKSVCDFGTYRGDSIPTTDVW